MLAPMRAILILLMVLAAASCSTDAERKCPAGEVCMPAADEPPAMQPSEAGKP